MAPAGVAVLVYGDRERVEDPRERLEAIGRRLAETAAARAGLERHAQLVALLVDAGELVQGLLDDEWAARGGDDWSSPCSRASTALLVALARAVCVSYATRFRGAPLPSGRELARVARLALPQRIRVRAPEGFVHYAVYPEAYAAAARGLPAPALVIGLRSIGASLGAMVAASAGARLVTVRPGGPPFQRRPSLQPEARALAAGRHVAIVDEGPGLSGSSLCGAAEWIRDARPAGLYLFPSHAGPPGPHASAAHRALWDAAERRVVGFDELRFGDGAPAEALARAAAPLIGALEDEPRELGAGAWRGVRYACEREWPCADVRGERRKYLVRAGGASWLLRFVGLGRHGEARLARARVLERGGFIPPVGGVVHGFLVQRWLDAPSLDVAREVDRGALISRVAEYLAFVARRFPARDEDGASPAQLLEQARHNTALALGPAAAAVVDRWRTRLPRATRRAHTDNKLHAHEWLVPARAPLLKTDALDHHAAHDVIGSQDPTWDAAAAAVELGLDRDEECALFRALTALGCPPAEPRAFFTECYLAFELARHTLAAGVADPSEAFRLRRAAATYARRLDDRLRTV